MQKFCLALDLIEDEAMIQEYETHHAPGNAWPEVTQHVLSIALNIPQKRITECFNKKLEVSFPLYRNTLRIQHATRLLRQGAHLTTSIEGIAERSGFKSKSAFYLAFKAVHGMSPIEWIQKNV